MVTSGRGGAEYVHPKNLSCATQNNTSCEPGANSIAITDDMLKRLTSLPKIYFTIESDIIGKGKTLRSIACWVNGAHINPNVLVAQSYQVLDCYRKT